MKHTMTAMAALATLAIFSAFFTLRGADSAEEARVRNAVGYYLKGQATGNGDYYRKVFHPEARMFAFRNGEFWQLTSADYATRAPGRPAEDEAQRRRHIESIDISGTAAMAKVVLDYPGMKYYDYLSLLKIDGEWKIVNKTFHLEQR
jgi:hypothetical protein